MNKYKSFTFLEVLITLTILSIISLLVVGLLKPQETFKVARDAKRVLTLNQIEKTLILYLKENPRLNLGSSTIIYISLPDNSASCTSWKDKLPPLPSGYEYRCSANPQNIDGTGWIPIDFTKSSITNISSLPLDPINNPPYYFTYVADNNKKSFEITAYLESDKNKGENSFSANDNGTNINLYEVGNDKKLLNLNVELGREVKLLAQINFYGYYNGVPYVGCTNHLDIVGNTLYVTPGYCASDAPPDPTSTIAVIPDLVVIDISTPSNPTILGEYKDISFSWGVKVIPPYAYVSYMRNLDIGAAKVCVLDISTPSNIIQKGCYSPGHWHGRGVDVQNNIIYFAAGYRGLRIVDGFNPDSLVYLSTYPVWYAKDIKVRGNYAYVADRNGQKFHIVDVSNPTFPTSTYIYSLPEGGYGVFIENNIAYVSAGRAGLVILDISNPYNPVLLSQLDTPGWAGKSYATTGYLFLADSEAGVHIINVKNPSNPYIVKTIDTPGIALATYVKDKILYIADDTNGLLIIDVSDYLK